MLIRFWMAIGFSMITFSQCVGENEETTRNIKSTEAVTKTFPANLIGNLKLNDDKKILFVTESMEELFSSGASEVLSLLTRELGSSLSSFQESVKDHMRLKRHISSISDETGRNLKNISNVHGRITRQVRKYVVRCCGSSSCSYSSRAGQRRNGNGQGNGFGNGYGFGNNGYGGYSPWNGFQSDSNVNRGTQGFRSVAVAMVLPHGVSISCPGCSPGWQQNLNFGHGVGFIPITCPGCPKGWQQMLNMGPAVDGGGGNEYDEETTTVVTTTPPTTTTEEITTTEETTVEATTEEATTEAATTAAAAAGGGGGLGGLLGMLG